MKTSTALFIALLATGGLAGTSFTQASAQDGSKSAVQAAPGCMGEQPTFNAWVNQMPGSDHKLIVTGKVQCPTTGWRATLVEAKPQGINPAILILEIRLAPPVHAAGNVITHVEVRFEQSNGVTFKQVTIRGAGPEFTLDVKSVQ